MLPMPMVLIIMTIKGFVVEIHIHKYYSGNPLAYYNNCPFMIYSDKQVLSSMCHPTILCS